MASDGGPFAASLVDVAVRAAVLAGAPRRTVAATAAAVASAVMVAMRTGAGAGGGAAAAPTASQLRRSKRKKKVAREALAAASRQPHDVEVAETMVHSGASDLSTPLAQATALDIAATPLPALAEHLPPSLCQHCGQSFSSRNGLFKHLKASGHGKFFAPSTSDSASGSGLPGDGDSACSQRFASLDDALRVNELNDTAVTTASPLEFLKSTPAGGAARSYGSPTLPSLQRRAQPYPAGKGP